ncbi:hypothetical protein M2138_000185 [Dysgonomonadaceae bacterium PH5-43]|nr:hypothetical protein [Dysgonomonadaceae bacterium PH5-43]
MEAFNGEICITGAEAMKVIPEGTFKSLIHRGKISNIAGKASYGNPALYPADSFPHQYKELLYEAYPELSDEKSRLERIEEQNAVLRNILPDPKARDFFKTYEKYPGIHLKPEEQTKYENSAKILNALRTVYERSYSRHAAAGKANKFREIEFWKRQENIMPAVSEKYPHTLPWNYRRLQQAYRNYSGNNYASLLSGKIGNQNRTKKQRDMITRIVISIYGEKSKPFMSDVTKIYNEFILGMREIYNEETGEIFNRVDFYRNGEPDTISDTMVFNILNDPLNRKIVDRMRNDFHYNQNKHNAAVNRKSPYHSLSKISMDDRDLVRKCIVTDKKGNKTTAWVHAYYAFDVASGCIIGSAYSLKKDTNLVMDCFRNMWNNLRAWGLRTPGEVEVENHLMKGTEIEGKLDRTFLHTTFTAPMNSREKRAEHKIKGKKYYGEYAEVRLGMAKGRHYAKHEAYLSTQEKVFDELNDTYKDQLEAWDFDRVVKEDQAQISAMNNAKHTAKDKKTGAYLYGGMTRMQVLVMKQHAELAPLNWRLLCKEWGKCTETSLKKGSTFTVDYREWWLNDASLIERFKPNNTNAQAYYIPDNNNEVSEIFIYQDERYIDSPRDLGRFQEAKIERTEEDDRIMHEQLGFISSAKKLAKEAKTEKHLGKIGSMKTETVNTVISMVDNSEATPIREQEAPELMEDYDGWESEDWAAKALNSM